MAPNALFLLKNSSGDFPDLGAVIFSSCLRQKGDRSAPGRH